MDKVYLSYYGNSRLLKKYKIEVVSISNSSPYKTNQSLKSLAPEWRTVKGGLSYNDFKKEYSKKLDSIGEQAIIAMLNHASSKGPIALCCYETCKTPEDWCHRTMLGEWLFEKTGIQLKEFKAPDEPKTAPTPPPILLF